MPFIIILGHCGGSTSRTELFKIVHIEGFSNEVKQVEYERTYQNGTTVKI
jgi:hypothetical protein